MFTLIQEEINAAVYDCHQISEILKNGIETVTIKEIRDIKVSTDKSDGSVLCSCMNFARFGFLCRHIFCVLKGNGVEVIPDKYILKRWTRDILPPHIRRKKQMFGFEGGRYMECSTTVYSAVEYCLNLLAKDEEKLVEFVENIKRLKTEVEERNPNAKPLSKIEMFNRVLGVEKPAVNTVNNPEPCSNKGNASGGQRKKSEIEKLREHMKKHKRLCKKCNKYRRHDSRNCPKKPDEIPTYSDSTVNDLGTGTGDDNCEDNDSDQSDPLIPCRTHIPTYFHLHRSIHYVKDADSDICEEIELSDGTFNYKPLVDESEKPKIGSEYPTIDKCIEMYAKYAEKSGFTIRKSTQEKLKSGIPSRKYLLCNKEGLPNGVNKDTMSEETSENRSGSIIRTGCLARAKFKINVTHTAYVLYEFEEAHNHTFVPKAYRNLTKKRKQMTHPEQIFVQQLGITSIGATRAHHLYASTHGGYELVNSTETEYRNHKRDLNTHIGDSDAQMLITKLTNRKTTM
ncbi:FAR1-related sequence 5-like protein [Tanacetum coccineum]|uniref:FAR1-related sequence 5-like protein n=1 Tax=Tanacetum coccineum TaxID=301880 RepID=A0ABQ5D812_9ASTR